MDHSKSNAVAVNVVNGHSKSDEASVTESTVESPVFCCGCLRRIRGWIPVHYKEEIGQILKLAGPVVRLQAKNVVSNNYRVLLKCHSFSSYQSNCCSDWSVVMVVIMYFFLNL